MRLKLVICSVGMDPRVVGRLRPLLLVLVVVVVVVSSVVGASSSSTLRISGGVKRPEGVDTTVSENHDSAEKTLARSL